MIPPVLRAMQRSAFTKIDSMKFFLLSPWSDKIINYFKIQPLKIKY
jgi:hypothetical protein